MRNANAPANNIFKEIDLIKQSERNIRPASP